MFTKKVITKWQADSYIQSGESDRDGPSAAALAELDAKVAEMIADGKMAVDSIANEDTVSNLISSIKLLTNQAAAEEWISWNNSFATKYGFVKRSSIILSN